MAIEVVGGGGGKVLYGSNDSKETMRVFASLFEHDVNFHFINVNAARDDHHLLHFLAQIPFGELPVFKEDDRDLVVFGSRAIIRYISHTYLQSSGKEQVYVSPRMQGLVSSWVESENHWFDPLAATLISELILKPKDGFVTDEAVVVETEAQLAKILDVYEEQLEKNNNNNYNYLVGDKFTSADLTHLPNLYYLMKTPTKRLFQERPRVAAWSANIMSRPAWAKVVATDPN